MTPAETLLSAAAILVKQAQAMQGQAPDPKLAEIIATWQKMVEQFENESKPHAWRDWGPGVLPEQAGNNERESPLWESAKPFWAQMERQIPFVYDDHGQRFNAIACVRRGGWADFERNVRRLWSGPEGDAWRDAPENADRVARIKV